MDAKDHPVRGTADRPAVIIHSGSTNSPPLTIIIHESGDVEYSNRPFPRADAAGDLPPAIGAVPADLAVRFYRHLRAAAPLSQYEDRGCVKSVSFGYSLRVVYRGERGPDLACPITDPRLTVLLQDVTAIEQAVRRMMLA